MPENKLQLIIEAYNKSKDAFAELEKAIKDVETSTARTSRASTGLLARMKENWMALSAAAVAAWMAIQKAMQYVELGARALQAETAYRRTTESLKVNADEMVEAMKKASSATIDESHLMQKAIKAMAQDVDPEKIPALFEAARVGAVKAGEDIGAVADVLIDSVANELPRMLRKFGLISKEEMNLFNKAIAAGAENLNLLDMVLANAQIQAAKMGVETYNAAIAVQQFKAQTEELKESVGKGLIEGLQKLMGGLQGIAGVALGAAAGIFGLLQGMAEAHAKIAPEHRVAGIKEAAEYWRIQKEAAIAASDELYKRSLQNIYGEGLPGQVKTQAELDKARAKAEAEKTRILEEWKKAAKAKEEAAKAKEWETARRGLLADISGAGLDEFEKKLIDIDKKAEDLRAKFGKKKEIETWAEAMKGEISTEQARKDFEEWLKIEKGHEEWRKKVASDTKAAREGEINDRLAALDLAEKEGTFHRDTIEERIALMEESRDIQEDYLATLDKQKDPASWYAQLSAINATKSKLAELRGELHPVFTSLNKYAEEATDVWKQVGTAVTGVFSKMEDALTEFVMSGKFKFEDFANAVIRDLVRIAVRAQITGPIAGFFSGLFGGGETGRYTSPELATGSTAGYEIGIIPGSHRGGMGNEPTFYRIVPNPGLLQRYHRGLGPGERYSITTDEEMILTPGQQKRVAELLQSGGGGKSGGDTYNIVNLSMPITAMDSRSVSQHLAQHKNQIVGMLQEAFNKLGKKGPLGQ